MKLNDDILTSALKICNDNDMSSIPDIIDAHHFSGKFERKMARVIRAHKSFRGSLGTERAVRYTTRLAAAVLCMVFVNVVSINAFHYDLWNAVYHKAGDMINIGFASNETEHAVVDTDTRLKIVSPPAGYEKKEEYFSGNISVQNYESSNGTITYTEGLITETADVNMRVEKDRTEKISVGAREVTLFYGKENITAFFQDNKYYHIIEVQGADANEKFVTDIIQKLEAQ